MTDDSDRHYFEKIEIETLFVLRTVDGKPGEHRGHLTLTPNNVSALAHQAVAEYPEEIRGRPFCLISRRSSPPETFTSAEHFVPEGLGFSWTKLPAGVGTCDRINAQFSAWELEWLRFGSMGIYRPFYVGEGKGDSPKYYAPKMSSPLFSLARDDDGARVISLFSEGSLGLPDQAGAGTLTIRVPTSEANSTKVSLALHKMAYLCLWLAQKNLVLDRAFLGTVDFLLEPTEQNYRPFRERMLEGAAPGVDLKFLIRADGVHVALRAHHMLYYLTLVGEMPGDDFWDEEDILKKWQPFGSPKLVLREISFGFSQKMKSRG